jgi:hypothetical protein
MRARLRGVEIGPTVSHKGVAIHHWLGGCEPLAVARKIDHSLHAVEPYLQHFARVVYLADKGFAPRQIALTAGISSATVKPYLEISEATRWQSRHAARYREIELIGDQHFAAEHAPAPRADALGDGGQRREGRLRQTHESDPTDECGTRLDPGWRSDRA